MKVNLSPLNCHLTFFETLDGASLLAQMVKTLPAVQETQGSIPESERGPGGGNGNPPQYSCLRNPMDRGAWWATVHGGGKRVGHN